MVKVQKESEGLNRMPVMRNQLKFNRTIKGSKNPHQTTEEVSPRLAEITNQKPPFLCNSSSQSTLIQQGIESGKCPAEKVVV